MRQFCKPEGLSSTALMALQTLPMLVGAPPWLWLQMMQEQMQEGSQGGQYGRRGQGFYHTHRLSRSSEALAWSPSIWCWLRAAI